MKPSITVTGADEQTDIRSLAQWNCEIGILYTATPEGRSRYPSYDWIAEVAPLLPRLAIHVCGRKARAELLNEYLCIARFAQRIQVNGLIPAKDVEKICEIYHPRTIITQHSFNNRHLLDVGAINHAILVDGSGGRGVSPDRWERPTTTKAVGFAGGLGPDNLSRELEKIKAVASGDWWVDMEGKLRINDLFSIHKATECIGAFHNSFPTC